MYFVETKQWTYSTYFSGVADFFTKVSATEEQARRWIEAKTPHGQGNYKADSLVSRTFTIKAKKLNEVDVDSI